MVVVYLIIAVVLIVCLVASFFVRHRESVKPQADWRRTEEVFNDPSTKRVMRVWLDTAGERHYVPESK